MSGRTLLVGLLAAVCGVFATAGVMLMVADVPDEQPRSPRTLVTARLGLELGQEISREILGEVEWYADALPPDAITDPEEVLGKFVSVPIPAGELLYGRKLSSSPTGLQLADGMRAFSIEAKSASANVGQNLMPGNRVDIIWQTNNRLDSGVDPISVRLIQNVRILAVADASGNSNQRSITLEVKPKMDENLSFAQAVGTLSLSLRNPNDNEGVDPVESVNFANLLAEFEEENRRQAEAARNPEPSAWEKLLATVAGRVEAIETQLAGPVPEKPEIARAAYERIDKGMRAITVQTPTESSGVAGLLVPGDRVDLQLTLTRDGRSVAQAVDRRVRPSAVPTETLIENIEVLAVDTRLYSVDSDGEKEMSRSVTLIVQEGMQRDIARAGQLGTLTLVLRGREDRETGPPRVRMGVDEFVSRFLPTADPAGNGAVGIVRTYRGQVPGELQFATISPWTTVPATAVPRGE